MHQSERLSLLATGRKLAKEDATITPEQFSGGFKFWTAREKNVIEQGYFRAVRKLRKAVANG